MSSAIVCFATTQQYSESVSCRGLLSLAVSLPGDSRHEVRGKWGAKSGKWGLKAESGGQNVGNGGQKVEYGGQNGGPKVEGLTLCCGDAGVGTRDTGSRRCRIV